MNVRNTSINKIYKEMGIGREKINVKGHKQLENSKKGKNWDQSKTINKIDWNSLIEFFYKQN